VTRVAVTGGAGFLGSHIVKRLLDGGHEVSIIDDFSSGSLRNLRDVGVRQKCLVGDLKDYHFARSSLRGAETVFHFAAEVGSVAYLHGSKSRELAALQSNLTIDTNVFKACLEVGVRCIIYASSVSVYPFDRQLGTATQFKEDDAQETVNPEGGYGWSKYVGEKQLALMPDIAYGVARIFHAYGKNIYLRPDRSQVIGSLVRKAIRYPKEDFVVWGDGRQKRCFVYINDAMDAIFRLQHYVQERRNLTVNVGSTEELTVLDLARLVIALSKKGIPMKFDAAKPVGALNRMPDLARIRSVLGWSPATGFRQGLSDTYEWAATRLRT
jgi:nucleoside-diphosphate-sugar epimerase